MVRRLSHTMRPDMVRGLSHTKYDREFGQGVVSYNEGGFNSGNHLIQLWQVLVRVWSHTMMAAFGQGVVSQNAGSF